MPISDSQTDIPALDADTFSGAIGDTLSLIAYGGKWYIIGSHQATIA